MDAIILTFIILFLAESGDRTQLLGAVLAKRFGHEGQVFLGLMCATVINCVLVAFAGYVMHHFMSADAQRMFAGCAYIFTAFGMLVWRRPLDVLEKWKTGPFLTAFLGIAILQFGDKGQFVIAAHAAWWNDWAFISLSGAAGIMAACAPAIYFKETMAKVLPMHTLRRFFGVLMMMAGMWLVLRAFRLI